MFKDCVPFNKKALYLVLTIPVVIIFVFIALYLWQIGLIPFIIYCSLFLLVILLQSYCCAHQECPYMGKFCPGIGGITILSSVLAILWKRTKKTKQMFNLFASIGFACLIGIVVFPLYFLYELGIFVLISYLVIALFYCFAFFALICPFCAIRDTCPGGRIAGQIFHS